MIDPLRPGLPVGEGSPRPIYRYLFLWLTKLAAVVNLGIVPPKGIVLAYLTADEVTANFDATGLGNNPGEYMAYAICNGNNGTPNLTDRFPRMNVTGAGATGGSDTNPHTHDSGTYKALIKLLDTKILAKNDSTDAWTSDYSVTATGFARTSPDNTAAIEGTDVQGTSGAASATENRPAYYELVPLMRVA